jgi:hypothetical protein
VRSYLENYSLGKWTLKFRNLRLLFKRQNNQQQKVLN